MLILFAHPGEDGSQGAHSEDEQQNLSYGKSHIDHSQPEARTHILSQFSATDSCVKQQISKADCVFILS